MFIAYTDTKVNTETILFIHGLGCTASIWDELSTALSANFRCIQLDLPSYGNSDELEEDYNLSLVSEKLYTFIQNLKIDPEHLHICGHSMGAQIAIILAIRYPSLFKKLILIAPAGFEMFSPQEIKMIKAASTLYPSELMKKSTYAMLNEPVHDYLHTLSHQTLIVFGTLDAMIPNPMLRRNNTEQLAQQCAKLIPHSTLILLPNKGHFLPLDSVKELEQGIRNFI